MSIFRYDAQEFIAKNEELAECIDQIESGYFTPDQPDCLKDIAQSLRKHDRFMIITVRIGIDFENIFIYSWNSDFFIER